LICELVSPATNVASDDVTAAVGCEVTAGLVLAIGRGLMVGLVLTLGLGLRAGLVLTLGLGSIVELGLTWESCWSVFGTLFPGD
jgi:hypothetical protein